jgi:hypothetical protein
MSDCIAILLNPEVGLRPVARYEQLAPGRKIVSSCR